MLPSPPPQKESAGYRLMSAMGWREGEGLGAAKQGIKQHIRVKKKFENWGVGAVSAILRWWRDGGACLAGNVASFTRHARLTFS